MAPRKLSDSDKSEIIDLYRQPGQTTSTLAEQYGVSNSTVSRILKNAIPADEYSELIAQKRMSGADSKSSAGKKPRRRNRKKETPNAEINAAPAVPEFEPAKNQPIADGSLAGADDGTNKEPAVKPPKLKTAASKKSASSTADKESTDDAAPPSRRRRRRSRAKDDETQLPLLDATEESTDASAENDAEEATEKAAEETKSSPGARPRPILASQRADDEEDDDEDDEDDLVGLDETLGDDFGDDDDEEEDDDEDDDSDIEPPKLRTSDSVSIMPLDEAVLPKPCYLVVDTRAELITRPLVEFSDLGTIPSAEERSNTLPVFDNHRVARRFSRNKQRVIKVPDGSLITRTRPYLEAKGITRLLVDGQVFDLVGAD